MKGRMPASSDATSDDLHHDIIDVNMHAPCKALCAPNAAACSIPTRGAAQPSPANSCNDNVIAAAGNDSVQRRHSYTWLGVTGLGTRV
jgi:hypothetical protein